MDNPYKEPEVKTPDTAKDLFGAYRVLPKKKGAGQGGRRGELLAYFCERLNPSRTKGGYEPLSPTTLNYILKAMPTLQDLDWLKSVCEDIDNRKGGASFSKRFWWIVKQQKRVDDLPDEFIHTLDIAHLS